MFCNSPCLAGAQCRGHRLRRAEPRHRGPKQQQGSNRYLGRCDDERELKQQQERVEGLRRVAMGCFIEHDCAAGAAQTLDQSHCKRCVARASKSVVGDDIGVRQHPDPAICFANFPNQQTIAGRDDRPQSIAAHQLDWLGQTWYDANGVGGPNGWRVLAHDLAAWHHEPQRPLCVANAPLASPTQPLGLSLALLTGPLRQDEEDRLRLHQRSDHLLELAPGVRLRDNEDAAGRQLPKRILPALDHHDVEPLEHLGNSSVSDGRAREGAREHALGAGQFAAAQEVQ